MTIKEINYLSELQSNLWEELQEKKYDELIKNDKLKGASSLEKEIYFVNFVDIFSLINEWARVYQICLDLNVPIIKTEKSKELSDKILSY